MPSINVFESIKRFFQVFLFCFFVLKPSTREIRLAAQACSQSGLGLQAPAEQERRTKKAVREHSFYFMIHRHSPPQDSD